MGAEKAPCEEVHSTSGAMFLRMQKLEDCSPITPPPSQHSCDTTPYTGEAKSLIKTPSRRGAVPLREYVGIR